jgi:hypothetical protein
MAQIDRKNKNSDEPEMNISRVRRAIDFSKDFTGGEKLIAGVIADHFNAEEGYAFPSYQYLVFVYGFTPSMVWKTVKKLKTDWMMIDKSSGNNQYIPNMRKVESVLAGLEAKRVVWKERKAALGDVSLGEAGTSLGEAGTSLGEAGTSLGEAAVPLLESPNVQLIAQPKAQHKRPTPPACGKHAPGGGLGGALGDHRFDEDGRLLPKWASHPQGLLAGDWTWGDREFQPAIGLLGLDEYQLDAEIDRFTTHHRGERRHDWNPVWLEWIQALDAAGTVEEAPF